MKHYTYYLSPSIKNKRLILSSHITIFFRQLWKLFTQASIKAIAVLAIALFFNSSLLIGQSNIPSNEIAKKKAIRVVETINQSFDLEKTQKQNIQDIFTDFYQGQLQLKNNIQRPSSGLTQGLVSQDFQSVRKQNEALITERDNSLKKQLSNEQYKKWKEVIEPSLNKRKKQ